MDYEPLSYLQMTTRHLRLFWALSGEAKLWNLHASRAHSSFQTSLLPASFSSAGTCGPRGSRRRRRASVRDCSSKNLGLQTCASLPVAMVAPTSYLRTMHEPTFMRSKFQNRNDRTPRWVRCSMGSIGGVRPCVSCQPFRTAVGRCCPLRSRLRPAAVFPAFHDIALQHQSTTLVVRLRRLQLISLRLAL
jgi:hypothetical protein